MINFTARYLISLVNARVNASFKKVLFKLLTSKNDTLNHWYLKYLVVLTIGILFFICSFSDSQT